MTNKRKLFDKLMDGVKSMQYEREGKITLRTHEVDDLPPLEIDAELIRETREQLHASRAVFARRIECLVHLKTGSREDLNPMHKPLR